MILYALFKSLIFIISLFLSLLTSIPGVSSINAAIQPYIDGMVNLISGASNLIGFFLPISLLKVLLPIIITIELVVDNINLIKFVLRKILNR